MSRPFGAECQPEARSPSPSRSLRAVAGTDTRSSTATKPSPQPNGYASNSNTVPYVSRLPTRWPARIRSSRAPESKTTSTSRCRSIARFCI